MTKKTVGRPRARAGEGDRGATILDVSERLFARHGYDGVTLRTIAREAGVDVALINYYFGPKQQLFDTVFQRRARVLNDDRLDALNRARAEAEPDPVPLERIIEAYLRPLEMAQESEDQGWRNYCALLAYVNTSPVWGPVLMSRHFDAPMESFVEALAAVLPGCDRGDLYWCYHFMSGSMTLTFANTGRINAMSGGLCRSDDFQSAYDRMIPFVVAGFERVCGPLKSDRG
ncbi:TetR/AcrR family transcriptional regulator [Alloalcanivorax gelatiniphagus]|uniref:TetR/AcrR family transcriptional regulator n=1 Tax=Alloalcanivorax gelatiniphagus TaxID=1194167 RepID=UPI001F0E5A7D|nr:TetR family transcriptional regulator [Alloalcanivorax gelatiniphagus]|tara:strand:- start:6166 stop:6855 length:690 start_codon:yes stop_codon:yes gene_type:complete